jgi:hypothetical protein
VARSGDQCSIAAVKALLVFVASGLGVGAWWRKRRRGSAAELPYESGPIAAPGASDPAAPDPAAELRAKLAESKAAPADEPAAVDEPGPEPSDPEKRRRALHEQARASIDELN